ncbi:restriction endonuclease subunit S [Flavobacterium sp.]|uniref:restriction endonuclease subunit S n=1 Tax=Flavobacterium sp. TaxID=239 RepID=UPI00286EF135|nr:restriction endonuclease subunit S [Flavobacterium sp.]
MEKKLPKNWQIKTLGEVCETTSGGTPSRGNKSYYNGTIPWVKSGELNKGIIYDTEEKITEEAIKNSSAKIFPKGTLLIALYGATIGKLAFLGVDAATNQAVCGIYQNDSIDSKYIYNFLFHKKQDLVKQGIGGAQPNISQTILKKLEIPLPPLETQQAIVSKIEELFSELDKGIEDLKTAQQQLKTYRQSVLKWAFEGKLTNENLKEGNLPKGWEITAINTVSSINPKLPNRENLDREMKVQFLPMKLVEEIVNKIHLSDIKKLHEVLKGSYTPFIDNDIIFAKVTPCMENGKIAIVEKLKNGIGFGSSEFHVIRTNEKVNNKFMFYFLVQDRFRNEAANEMTGAVGLRRVPKQFIENYQIPLPLTLEEQNKIVEELESRLSVADKMEESIVQSLQQAEALRQSILVKAFSGELV